jgi:hypothetical protein
MTNEKSIKKQYAIYQDNEFQGFLSKKEFERIKKDKENFDDNYIKTKQNAVSNYFNYSYNKKNVEKNVIEINVSGQGVIKTDKIEYKIENFANIKKFIRISTEKLLRYSIYRMNEKNFISRFTLSEYAKACKKNNSSIAKSIKGDEKKGIIGDLQLLKMITNISYSNEKEDIMEFLSIITDTSYSNGKIKVEFSKKFARSLKYYMFLPRQVFEIDDKKHPHAYNLICYWYEQARINKKRKLHLKIESNLERITLPSKNEVKNWKYEEKIIKPFENTLDFLSSTFEVKATPEKDYANINDFLNGYINVEIENHNIVIFYKKKKLIEEKKKLKNNIENKASRKNNTLKLLKKGRTDKEIMEILKLSKWTIKRYIEELKAENKI